MSAVTARAPMVDVEGGKFRLNLHAGQVRAWESGARFVFMLAGSQGGKTAYGPWWLRREIERCGPGDYIAATATFDLFKLKMLPELRRVFCQLFWWQGWQYKAADRIIESDQVRARIILRSADSDGGMESATALAAWLDECGQNRFRVDAWEAVQRRLSLHQGRVLGTTTPYNLGWVKREIYDRWKAGDPDIDVVQFSSVLNPAFPRAEFDRMKSRMARWKFAMFYQGRFERPEGLIYGDFSDDNVCDSFAVPADWPRIVGVDFGAVNTATVWIAEGPDGTYYVYRETLEGGMTTKEHVAKAKWRAAQDGVKVIGIFGGAPSETQQRMDWSDAGVTVERPPISDVEGGIDRVIALVKERKLKVIRTCRGLLDEIGTYSRLMDRNDDPTEKIADKETFHRLDALRYAASGLGHVGGSIYVRGGR